MSFWEAVSALPGVGAVDITIATSYPLGRTATIPVTVSATRGTVAGPVTARVLASGIGDANVR